MMSDTATVPHESNSDAANPLLDIPLAALGVLRGERRSGLIAYLLRWQHDGVLRHYLETWLDTQTEKTATLRAHYAHALVRTGEPEAALAVLDALDEERGPAQSRATLRTDALAALGRHDDLLALAPEPEDDFPALAHDWLRHGDALRAAGRFDEAANAYAAVIAAQPDAVSPALLRRLAALALAGGDAAAARGHLETLFVRTPDTRPTVDDLRLLHDAVIALEDTAAARSLAVQIAAREREERAVLVASLGLSLTSLPPLPHAGEGENRRNGSADIESLVADDGSPPLHPVERGEGGEVLPPEAYAALRDIFGLADFRPNQAATVAYALAGQPALAVMPTGAGKSLTYQLPATLLPHATLVVSPLIALMQDQVANLPPALREHATAINSSLSAGEVRDRLRGVAAGAYKLVYVAPERLRNRPFLHALRRAGVSLFVVDEAHCVSMWGLSFRPDYLFLDAAIRALDTPPVLALTATAGAETQAEIADRLGTTERVQASVFRPNLRFEVFHAGNKAAKRDAVLSLCTSIAGPVIVYARSRDACEELAAYLRQHGVSAAHYHAQTPNRAAVQERFMAGETRVLVATVAFGMGVDKADVRAIIHFNLPQSVEAYYQEAGRAGRDGQSARCILLYSASDKAQMMRWLNEGAITKDHLRHLYRILRERVGSSRYGIMSLDDVGRAAARVNPDDTFARVGVSMLERVGLVRRHFDVPRQLSVTLRNGQSAVGSRQSVENAGDTDGAESGPSDFADHRLPAADFDAFVAATGLYLDETGEYDTLALAKALAVAPDELEAALLGWQDAGLVRYRGEGRDALIELLPAPADVGERIDALLADYAARQEARVEAMAAYARSATCRHQTIAAHFGQRLGRCGTACDLCLSRGAAGGSRQRGRNGVAAGFSTPIDAGLRTPAPPKPLPVRDRDPRPDALRVLAGVAAVPYPLGRTGLMRTLRGTADAPVKEVRCVEFGVLTGRTVKHVEDLIGRLIEDGLLHRDTSNDYRLLSLTDAGRTALQNPEQLPEWAQPAAHETPDDPDPNVLTALTAWRTEQARAKDLPPHYILSQATLEALATLRPRTEADLLTVRGIGPKIAEQYGDQLLALLA